MVLCTTRDFATAGSLGWRKSRRIAGFCGFVHLQTGPTGARVSADFPRRFFWQSQYRTI